MSEAAVSFSPMQGEAIRQAVAWATDWKDCRQVFKIFGYAGSGKTTIAKEIAAAVGGVLFATFSGKASLVMAAKGCYPSSTIHSLIYKAYENQLTGEVSYGLNRESDLYGAKLLIVDEVSQVNEELGADLLGFGVKILVLGDPFQLPPIEGAGYFIDDAGPDIMLTEVHRQAAESPIIRMSMDVRAGKKLQVGSYGSCEVIKGRGMNRGLLRERAGDFDQVLCGKNRTRHSVNSFVREALGRAGEGDYWHPVAGDRLVCLKNNRHKSLLNGGLWEVDTVKFRESGARGEFEMGVHSLDVAGLKAEVTTPSEFFLGIENELDWRVRKQADQFCHGYGLTVHKSQGSQWDKVLLVDESSAFKEVGPQHLYTGLTRAAEELTVVLPS